LVDLDPDNNLLGDIFCLASLEVGIIMAQTDELLDAKFFAL
jgi:hypothetical protein